MHRAIVALFCTALLVSSALGQRDANPATGLSTGQHGDRPGDRPADLPAGIAAVVRAFQQEHDIPGISIGLVVGEQPVAAEGFGFADLENEVPATKATVYRLASISKPITAMCIMQLVDAGKVDLDAPIADYVPEWPTKRWPVTCRRVLAHLGGVRHYKAAEGESYKDYGSQRAALERFARDPLLHEPGTEYRYSTFGYNLLAAVVEAQSDQAFPEYVRQHIAGPAGASSLQDDDVQRLIMHRAQGYVRRGNVLQNSRLMDASYKLGGGGLCCNAPDLARVGRAFLNTGLCSAAAVRAMTTRQKKADGAEISYGLGWSVAADRSEFSHSGAQSRVSTVLVLRPATKTVVAVLCNLEGQRLQALARRIADLANAEK